MYTLRAISKDSLLVSFYPKSEQEGIIALCPHLNVYRRYLETTRKNEVNGLFVSDVDTSEKYQIVKGYDIVAFSYEPVNCAQFQDITELKSYWISDEFAWKCLSMKSVAEIVTNAKGLIYNKGVTIDYLAQATSYRMAGQNQKSYECCLKALENHQINAKIYYEMSIVSYYVGKKDIGRNACEKLILSEGIDDNLRKEAKKNVMFYMTAFPVIGRIHLKFPMLPNYHALNPSIIRLSNGYRVLCRTTNYVQDKGRYTIYDQANIIRSKPYLLDYDENFQLVSCREIVEDISQTLRIRYGDKPFQGFEDGRLFAYQDNTYFTATAYDTKEECIGMIALCQLDKLSNTISSDTSQVSIVKVRILPNPEARWQKNWLPFIDNDNIFSTVYGYDPLTIHQYTSMFEGDVSKQVISNPGIRMQGFKGSAGPLAFTYNNENGYLLVTHECTQTDRLYYFHRFIWLNSKMIPTRLTRVFHFGHQGIEFCSGISYDRTGTTLILGVGKEDREAWLYTVTCQDITSSLFPLTELCIPVTPNVSIEPRITEGFPKATYHAFDKVTLVTCFYDLSRYEKRARSKDVYLENMKYVLSFPVHLVIYTTKEEVSYIREQRKSYLDHTTIILRDLEDLDKYRYFDTVKSFPRFDNYYKPKDTDYYFVVQNSKLDMIRGAMDYCQSEYIGWIDIGICHVTGKRPFECQKFEQYQNDKIRVMKIRNRNERDDSVDTILAYYWDIIAMGFFLGKRDMMNQLWQKYEETFQLFMDKKRFFLDGQVMRHIYLTCPELFDTYLGDYRHLLCNFFSYEVIDDFIKNLMREETKP